MKTDTVGNPIFSFDDLFEVMHSGKASEIFNLECDDHDEISKFNKVSLSRHGPELRIHKSSGLGIDEVDRINQEIWFIPVKYQTMDIYEELINRCSSQRERDRISIEMNEYERRGMIPVLKCMWYLVEYMKNNNIVYGVGRGSSVSSMVLYLIGVHRINPLKYNLDFNEFMRGD